MTYKVWWKYRPWCPHETEWQPEYQAHRGCCFLIAKLCPFVIPWTVACQAPLSMGCPRQEYCSGLPFPSPGDIPHPGCNPCLLHGRRVLCHWATWETLPHTHTHTKGREIKRDPASEEYRGKRGWNPDLFIKASKVTVRSSVLPSLP